LWRVTDIAAVAALARSAGARCVCDNTASTSVLQRPFAHGAPTWSCTRRRSTWAATAT